MSEQPPGTVKIDHVEHNPDGTTTVFGKMLDGTMVCQTFQPGATVLRVKKASDD